MRRSKTQAEPLLALDHLLRNNKYPNGSTFAAKWKVLTKTIQRDIEFLKDRMGAPIEYDALKRGFYYTGPTFMLPALLPDNITVRPEALFTHFSFIAPPAMDSHQ